MEPRDAKLLALKPTFSATVQIGCKPTKAWNYVKHLDTWPTWNKHATRVDGKCELGAKATLWVTGRKGPGSIPETGVWVEVAEDSRMVFRSKWLWFDYLYVWTICEAKAADACTVSYSCHGSGLGNRDVSAANVIRVLLILKLLGFDRPAALQRPTERPPQPPEGAG